MLLFYFAIRRDSLSYQKYTFPSVSRLFSHSVHTLTISHKNKPYLFIYLFLFLWKVGLVSHAGAAVQQAILIQPFMWDTRSGVPAIMFFRQINVFIMNCNWSHTMDDRSHPIILSLLLPIYLSLCVSVWISSRFYFVPSKLSFYQHRFVSTSSYSY